MTSFVLAEADDMKVLGIAELGFPEEPEIVLEKAIFEAFIMGWLRTAWSRTRPFDRIWKSFKNFFGFS